MIKITKTVTKELPMPEQMTLVYTNLSWEDVAALEGAGMLVEQNGANYLVTGVIVTQDVDGPLPRVEVHLRWWGYADTNR